MADYKDPENTILIELKDGTVAIELLPDEFAPGPNRPAQPVTGQRAPEPLVEVEELLEFQPHGPADVAGTVRLGVLEEQGVDRSSGRRE